MTDDPVARVRAAVGAMTAPPIFEPTKADPDDLLFQTVEELETEPVDLADLGDRVLKEMRRRFANPVQAAELPGTFLMKLSTYFIEKNERETRERLTRSEERFLSAVEVVDHPGLPEERREELIREHLQRIEIDREMLEAKLEELT